MITIGFLADHPDTIPVLAKWFRNQWPDYYVDWSQAEMEKDFLEDTSRDSLPCRLVAFESGELVGTVILRDSNTEMLPEFQPELGGLFVMEFSSRSRCRYGVGSRMHETGYRSRLQDHLCNNGRRRGHSGACRMGILQNSQSWRRTTQIISMQIR